LPRGRHGVGWVPAWSGRHRLRIVAIGPAGTRAVFRHVVRVKARHDVKRRKAAKRRAAAR